MILVTCFINPNILKAKTILIGNVQYEQIDNTNSYKNLEYQDKPSIEFKFIDSNDSSIYNKILNGEIIKHYIIKEFDCNKFAKALCENKNLTFKFDSCYFYKIIGLENLDHKIKIYNLDIRNCGFAKNLQIKNLEIHTHAIIYNSNLDFLILENCKFDNSLKIERIENFDLILKNTELEGNVRFKNLIINNSEFENIKFKFNTFWDSIYFLKSAKSIKGFHMYNDIAFTNLFFAKNFTLDDTFIDKKFEFKNINFISSVEFISLEHSKDKINIVYPNEIANFNFFHNTIFNNCKFTFYNGFYVSTFKIDLQELLKIKFNTNECPGTEYFNIKFYNDIITYTNSLPNEAKILKDEVIEKYSLEISREEARFHYENSKKDYIVFSDKFLSILKYYWKTFLFDIVSTQFGLLYFIVMTIIFLLGCSYLYFKKYNLEIEVLINTDSFPNRDTYIKKLNSNLLYVGKCVKIENKKLVYKKINMNSNLTSKSLRFSEIFLFNLDVFFNPKYKKEYLYGCKSLSIIIFIEYLIGLLWVMFFLSYFAEKFVFLKVLIK
ncbi:MAG: hypothetical protein K1X86_13495 [Ignavibacteria bacterium]|nr:hypothetical protein [Ignavibacteria bacterium]